MGLGIIILSQAVALLATSVKSSAVHKGAEDEVGTGSELWYKSHILSQPPRAQSGQLRKQLKWMSIEKRREMARAILVWRCVMKKA